MQVKDSKKNKDIHLVLKEIIGDTKIRFQENGIWFMFWGLMSTIIPIVVYYISILGLYEYSHIPYYGFA